MVGYGITLFFWFVDLKVGCYLGGVSIWFFGNLIWLVGNLIFNLRYYIHVECKSPSVL